ncbi:hypothetical protein [uncultured Pontibacter sp.]|uniref:hypothetical protein n=1 Tax=uncultured Pontibacter sp. TaxID=453356 RepID=UPI0026130C12|nr:hypothetical protein [uncultured Pontibacter sp.]
MTTATNNFFKTERTASEIKLELLPRVFEIFVTSLLLESKATAPVLCLDLLAGMDGHEPTLATVQWLRQVYSSTNSRLDLNQGTQVVLYDADKSALAELQERIKQHPFLQELQHPPVVLHDEALLQELLEAGPHLVGFLNPFKDSCSLEMLFRAAMDEQADLFMFFPLEDMRIALKKAKPDSPLSEHFGDRLTQIKEFQKKTKNTDRREEFLLDNFDSLLKEKGCHVFRFRVNHSDKAQSSYYLVSATKSAIAHLRLKELMQAYSDVQEDGVPLFGANLKMQQTSLFHEHYKYSISNLVQELLQKASMYNNMALQQVYEKHSIGTHYILENYKLAYERLLRQGKVHFINPKTGQTITKPTYTSKVRYSS